MAFPPPEIHGGKPPKAAGHCDFVLGDDEKEKLVEYMRTYERLNGQRIIFYCIMSNHFHLIVEVPQRPGNADLPKDAALVARVREYLGDKAATALEWELDHHLGQGNHEAAAALRERWFSRMWNISTYMKVQKQRFSQWFNGRYARRGILWEDRYRSERLRGQFQSHTRRRFSE